MSTQTHQPDAQFDRPLLGILLMLGFCISAPAGDAFAKILGDRLPLLELVMVRFAAQVILLLPLVMIRRLPWRSSGTTLWLVIARTVLHILGIGMMFSALRYLPLADAIAIAFVMPFIMLILGRFVLNETIGRHRIFACIVGFIGTLLVVQPSFAQVGAPAFLPLGVAVDFALFMLVTRQIARQADPIALQAVSGGIALLILIPLALLGLVAPPEGLIGDAIIFKSPETAGTWGYLALIGALGTIGHLLMTWSLRYAPSATLAPMQYLEIPFATIIGWLMFQDFPNGLAAIGILVTTSAGLYIIWREQAIARRATTPAAEN
ncbi:DMT family transporter [Halocynthiibacter namhaensis]|uniref:DMT family transporter n=1 Tax=Halocynthiibacter namhaensis TaxID=1290553 RepID=UPI0006896C93|nr:DMT family transporter [Halocynthiibacter namhaensis]